MEIDLKISFDVDVDVDDKIATFLQNGSNMPSPLGAKVARNPPIFFIDYDVFQLVLQHIQKRKNL